MQFARETLQAQQARFVRELRCNLERYDRAIKELRSTQEEHGRIISEIHLIDLALDQLRVRSKPVKETITRFEIAAEPSR